MDSFKDSFYKLRKAKGLSQQQFADKIGISRVTLSSIERGTEPSFDTVNKTCEAFDISKNDLLALADKSSDKSNDSNWKDEAYRLMEKQVEKYEKEVAWLRDKLDQALSGNNGPFLAPTRNKAQLTFSFGAGANEVGQRGLMTAA